MHSDWQNYANALNTSASIDPAQTPLLCFPAGFALLSVSGEDRHAFLHGQLINDLNLIKEPGAQLSGWCNPRGQLITNFLVVNTGTAFLLLFRKELLDYVLKRLNMFVLRANVTVEDITETTPLLGIANCEDPGLLDAGNSNTPGAVSAHDGVISVCLPDESQRYLLFGNVETQVAKTTALQQSLTLTGADTWSLLDILAGIPWIGSATQEKFLPQMLNLDFLNGLSYKKGCYPGQEVIARLHYRGEVKRRMQLVKSEAKLVEGMVIKSQDNNAGTVINSAIDSEGNAVALAVIDLDKLDNNLYPDNTPDTAIQVLPLPYADHG